MKRHTSLTVNYIGEIDTSSNTGPHKIPYMLSGVTRIKRIFGLLPDIGNRFIGNAPLQLVHILHFIR